MDGAEARNVSGALIFLSYIVAALFLTGFISRQLYSQYRNVKGEEIARNASLRHSITTFALLALLSFSTLSYHMINVLVTSYRDWAMQKEIRLPRDLSDLLSGEVNPLLPYLWPWMTTSTLFQDFVEAIIADSGRYWWAQDALIATLAVHSWMVNAGRQPEPLLVARWG